MSVGKLESRKAREVQKTGSRLKPGDGVRNVRWGVASELCKCNFTRVGLKAYTHGHWTAQSNNIIRHCGIVVSEQVVSSIPGSVRYNISRVH